MYTLGIILGTLLLIAGLVGSFVPFIPGPPLAYGALLLHQFTGNYPYSTQFLLIWAGVTIGVMLLENLIPAWGTQRFGGTRYGIAGCIIGLLTGAVLFPPFGIILGPLVGAFLGEFLAGQTSDQALRSAWGSFMGFLTGVLIKVITVGLMGYFFTTSLL